MIRGANSLNINDDVERFLNIYSIFTPEEIVRLTGKKSDTAKSLIAYYYDILNCKEQTASVDRMMSIDMRMNLADDLLLYTDKITMNFSLECRVPVLDNVLTNFLESLPAEYKLNSGKTKIIHKEYARKILPKKLSQGPNWAFNHLRMYGSKNI